jgi:hypothetical protein
MLLCSPGTASTFFCKLPVTVPVAPIISSIITHFVHHILCISKHKLPCLSFFPAAFRPTFLYGGIAPSISMHIFSHLFSIIISVLFSITPLYYYIMGWTIWCSNPGRGKKFFSFPKRLDPFWVSPSLVLNVYRGRGDKAAGA